MQVLGNLLGRGDDVRHVRVFGLAQRRRHADVDRVEIAQHGKIRRRIEPVCLTQRRDIGGRHIGNVRAAGHDLVDLALIEIDAGRLQPVAGEFHCQRQADIAEPDHARACLAFQNSSAKAECCWIHCPYPNTAASGISRT